MVGAGPAPARRRGGWQGQALQQLGQQPRLLIVPLAHLKLPPQRSQHGHTGDLRQRALDIGQAQIVAAQPPLDARQQLRRAS